MDTYGTKQQDKTQRIVGDTAAYRDHVGPGPEIMAAATLTGNDVVNAAGEDLGEIEHIMLDVPRGRIAYAVLSFGGFLGMGEKIVRHSLECAQTRCREQVFYSRYQRRAITRRTGIRQRAMALEADQKWARDIHSYYSSPPYWE